jgi:predicted PurR-regulated permease PerM
MADLSHVHVEISSASIFRLIAIVLAVFLLYVIKDVVFIFLFGIIIASAISPFANWIDDKGFPRVLGVLILFLVIIGLAVLVVSLVVPYLAQEATQLSSALPKFVAQVSNTLETAQKSSPKYLDFLGEIQNVLDGVSSYFQQASQSVIGFVVSVFGGIFSFVAIVIISFYLSVMKKGIETFLGSVVPEKYEGYVIDLWKRSEVKVGRWLQGQLLLALIVGLVVYIGLSLIGIKYALALGILTMILEIVPMVGPVLAAIPAVFLGFVQSPSLGLWLIVFYTVVQQLENHILVPLVIGKSTGLNPVVVIMALLIGGSLAGIPGMILCVPIATVIVEILDDMAKHKELRRIAV